MHNIPYAGYIDDTFQISNIFCTKDIDDIVEIYCIYNTGDIDDTSDTWIIDDRNHI